MRDAVQGSNQTTWRAYLSTTAPGGEAGVNARDRIGNGLSHFAKGVVIAKNVDELHSAVYKISQEIALNEKGEIVDRRSPRPHRAQGHATHDFV